MADDVIVEGTDTQVEDIKVIPFDDGDSGLSRSMNHYAESKDGDDDKEKDVIDKKSEEDDGHEVSGGEKDNDGKVLDEADKPDDVPEDDYSEYLKKLDKTHLKDISDDDMKNIATKNHQELIEYAIMRENDMKKFQRISDERQNQLEKLGSAKDFFDGLKKDFIGTYKRFQKEYDLPDISFLQKQVASGGDVSSRLEQWQTAELVSTIEEKFKLEGGEFVYDPSEAYTAGTPSYEYRIQTERKEREMFNEYENVQEQETEAVKKMLEQRNKDLIELRQAYFPDESYESPEQADDEFKGFLGDLDSMYEKMKGGDFTPDANPFSLRNIFRGVHFDRLAQRMVDGAVKKVHEEYSKHSLHLPDNNDLPTDATSVHGEPPKKKPKDKQRTKFSPLYRTIKH